MSAAAVPAAVAMTPSRVADYFSLTKPGIVGMVALTTLAGYLIASDATVVNGATLLHTLLGTGLTAAGGAALNMFLERGLDARMARTAGRPVPSGRLHPGEALGFGLVLSAAGITELALFTSPLAAELAAASLALYAAVYTPMKTRSEAFLLVGAVAGALPPVVGYAAVTGMLMPEAAIPFLLLLFWQLPHFLALAWRLRDDYSRAGVRVSSVSDPAGGSTSFQVTGYATALLAASALPLWAWGPAPWIVHVAIFAAGAWIAAISFRFARSLDESQARVLFLSSLVYLPFVMVLLVVAKRLATPIA